MCPSRQVKGPDHGLCEVIFYEAPRRVLCCRALPRGSASSRNAASSAPMSAFTEHVLIDEGTVAEVDVIFLHERRADAPDHAAECPVRLVNSTTVLAAARPFEPDDREYDSCSHGDPRHPEMVRQRRNVIDVCAEEKSQQAPDQHPERAA